jgi:2-(1,2-epoxy-1,2-dihydrophenyl)acetyl-CoA isomerase
MVNDWVPIATFDALHVLRRRGALHIELARPDRLNAFDEEMSREFLSVVRDASEDSDIRALLLSGSGRAFCAGADIHSAFTPDGRTDLSAGMRELTNPTILALREMGKPVIAAVNGPAAGLGCSIALASDVIIAAEPAYFLLAFTALGLHPDGGAMLTLAARVGFTRAFRMSLLGERVKAADALAWGMIDRVTTTSALISEARALTLRLASGPTRSYAATKRVLNAAVLSGLPGQLELEAEIQGELGHSRDFAEGVCAFAAKRPPVFTGT